MKEVVVLEHENKRDIKEILGKYSHEQRHSLAILQEVQKEYSYISPDHLKAISYYLRVPVAEIFSIATFYKALSLDKKGRIIIKVCDGTACHIRGSETVLNECKRALNIDVGETTQDGLFSLEVVNCVGSCAIAPVLVCQDEFHGKLQSGQAEKIISVAREEADHEE